MNRVHWTHNFIAGVAGLFGGLLGVGGGFFYIPMVSKFIGTEDKKVHAQALAIGMSTALLGSFVYAHDHIDVLRTLILSSTGIVGAIIGAKRLGAVPVSLLRLMFGCTLLLMALLVVLDAVLPHIHLPMWPLPIVGLLVGTLGGLLGIGGGSIIVPILLLGYGMTQLSSQGTALLTILPTATAGFLSHRRERRVSIGEVWVPALFAGAAGAVGAALAIHLPDRLLQWSFVVFLSGTAIRSIVGSWQAAHSPSPTTSGFPG